MDHHYYCAHAMGWATAETREAAHKKLMGDTDPQWIKNCLKAGTLLPVYSCRVEVTMETHYAIEWYVPVGVPCSEGQHHLCTYLTKKEHTLIRDPVEVYMAKEAEKQLAAQKKEKEELCGTH